MNSQRAPSPALSASSSQSNNELLQSLPAIRLERGLDNQDDNLDLLMSMYEDLQLSSAEAAREDNFMLFVEKTCYFAVIHKPQLFSNTQMPPKPPIHSAYRPSAMTWSSGKVLNDDPYYYTNDELELEEGPDSEESYHPAYLRDRLEELFESSALHQDNIALGFIFLTRTQDGEEAQASGGGELNIGVIINPAHRGKGYARAAVAEVLRRTFMERVDCHRVQALLPGVLDKDRAIHLFTELGFAHEGTRRRAFYSFGEWKDITCLGILNTEWAFHTRYPGPTTLWDEMFKRHQRERDELLAWEERSMVNSLLKRTSSMETICPARTPDDSSGASTPSESAHASDASSISPRNERPLVSTPEWPNQDDGDHEQSAGSSQRFDHGHSYFRAFSSHPSDTDDDEDFSEQRRLFERDLGQEPVMFSNVRFPRSVSSTFSISRGASQSPYPPSDTASESESSTSGWSMMDQDDYDILSSMESDEEVEGNQEVGRI